MNQKLLRNYARLIVRVGANLRPGMKAVVTVAVDQKDLAAQVVKECYACGASAVRVEWYDETVSRLHYLNQATEELASVARWEKEKMRQTAQDLPCRIYIDSDDPDAMKGIEQGKLQAVARARSKAFKPYRDAMDNKHAWVIAAAPSKAWAKKVFPKESPAKATEKLWEAILDAVRVTEDNDPVAEWNKINESFRKRSKWLNDNAFTAMEYESSNGTSFRAGLIPGVKWEGGGEFTLDGHYFNPNLPTEEIFTTPMRGVAEGTLVSTKPLSYHGQLIERFSITFENGKAVRWQAEKGQAMLDRLLSLDAGAKMLGELALVPKTSPIARSGLLYYNTLFDENASCHVALGEGFTNLYPGFETMTRKELTEKGINDSLTHVDFMIGADDLSVTGVRADGTRVPVFRNGTWADGV